MVYAEDLNSLTRKGLRVRLPPRANSHKYEKTFFFTHHRHFDRRRIRDLVGCEIFSDNRSSCAIPSNSCERFYVNPYGYFESWEVDGQNQASCPYAQERSSAGQGQGGELLRYHV